jgi:hypothetical protein
MKILEVRHTQGCRNSWRLASSTDGAGQGRAQVCGKQCLCIYKADFCLLGSYPKPCEHPTSVGWLRSRFPERSLWQFLRKWPVQFDNYRAKANMSAGGTFHIFEEGCLNSDNPISETFAYSISRPCSISQSSALHGTTRESRVL